MGIDRGEIISLTEEYGGVWGINHTRRLLHTISVIGEGLSYNHDAIWLAAHLHDWGAYSEWVKPEVDHAVRSRQVAEDFLVCRGCEKGLLNIILESIEFHHSDNHNRSTEAMLLSDADILDFLGVVGILRDFSKKPYDMRKAYETIIKRREKLPGMLCIEKSRQIAESRIKVMDDLFEEFNRETSGYF